MKSYSILLSLIVLVVILSFVADNEVTAAPAPCGYYNFPHRHRWAEKKPKEDKKDKDKDKKDKDKDKKSKLKELVKALKKNFEKFLKLL